MLSQPRGDFCEAVLFRFDLLVDCSDLVPAELSDIMLRTIALRLHHSLFLSQSVWIDSSPPPPPNFF